MHYYQFNIADFRAATGHLSLLERGVYRELLDWYYLDEKPIPLETQWVARRFPTETQWVISILEEFFQKTENGWHHRRVDLEINNYRHNVEKNRINGKLGGRPKKTGWVNLANPNETQTKANQEPITKNQSKPIEGFDDFWKAYPTGCRGKTGKGLAEAAFAKAGINGSLPKILAALEAQSKSEQWTKERGQYIPNPATWLNQRRWEDETSTPTQQRPRIPSL